MIDTSTIGIPLGIPDEIHDRDDDEPFFWEDWNDE